MKDPANAIRRLCGTWWGGSPAALLHLHNGLVVSRITYGPPFLTLSMNQPLIIEMVYQAGITTALGAPHSTSTAEILAEVSSVPIMSSANIRLLSQLLRLHRTLPGRQLLDKASGRTSSQLRDIT